MRRVLPRLLRSLPSRRPADAPRRSAAASPRSKQARLPPKSGVTRLSGLLLFSEAATVATILFAGGAFIYASTDWETVSARIQRSKDASIARIKSRLGDAPAPKLQATVWPKEILEAAPQQEVQQHQQDSPQHEHKS